MAYACTEMLCDCCVEDEADWVIGVINEAEHFRLHSWSSPLDKAVRLKPRAIDEAVRSTRNNLIQ